MELDFCNEGPVTFDKYETIYQQLLTKTISHLHLGGDYYVSVTIIDNETIHGINKQYRNVDRPTDVISFALLDNEQNKPIPGMIIDLGEILISYEKAQEQAKQYGHSEEREFSFLFVHGLLHLLGYDHMEEDEEKIMFSKQKELLNSYEITR